MNDDNDIQIQSYQDDLTTDDIPDPIMQEEGEDPTEELGVPPEELRAELDKALDDEDEASDNDVDIHDDEREYIEDQDDADESAATPGAPS